MLRFFLIVLFSVTCIAMQAGTSLSKEDFLYKYYIYKDANPIWQEDADNITHLFRKILKKDYNEQEKDRLLAQALELVYDNTMDSFEDAVDIKRMAVRRSMSFATVALIADEYRYNSFLEDAKQNLKHLADLPSLHEHYLMLDLIHLLKAEEFMGKDDWEYQAKREEMKAYLEKYKGEIENFSFLSDLYTLIQA